MKREVLNKTFMMISNRKRPLVSLVYMLPGLYIYMYLLYFLSSIEAIRSDFEDLCAMKV